MRSGRWFRIASLLVPSAIAARYVRADERILHEVAPVLVMLWTAMVGALVMRFVEARDDRRSELVSPWEGIDILTTSGVSMMWLGAGALLLAGKTGWASLSVVGILGLGTVYLVASWTAIVGCGTDRWRGASLDRQIAPAIATEGDPLREELKLANVAVPSGMRLFISGRAMKYGALSRYVVGSEASGAEVALASELGPAQRGEHHAEPLELWLGDVLGLTRTPSVRRAPASFSVLPRAGAVEGATQLLGTGGDAAVAHPTQQLPTEGTFRIREYVPGDDTRRIHWVRSAQQDQLVVRLPDEVPPADPVVRLVLDNELPVEAGVLTTRAPDELLDAMVRVWLGIGKGLAAQGTRVVLVTAVPHNGQIKKIERVLFPRSQQEALRVGMKVTWQGDWGLDKLLDARGARQIVVTGRPRRTKHDDISWVVVPEGVWTTAEPSLPDVSATTHPYPSGSPENRGAERVRERRRVDKMWGDRMLFSQLVGWTDWSRYSGHHVARSRDGKIVLGVIP
jgi:uncharacterized protein (DUF58 family)